jgi:hypothetical protein
MLIVFISLILYRDKPEAQARVVWIGGHRAGAIQFPTGLAKLGIEIMGDTNYSCVPHPDAPHGMDIQIRFIGAGEPRFPSIGQFLITLCFRFKLCRHFRDCVMRCGCQGPFQGDFQNFVHVLDEP